MKITAHTLVKNEDRFIWYSIMSVINYVDEYIVWDTGSTDKTIQIIESIHDPKIKFKRIKTGNVFEEDKVRQEMLDETKSDWFLTVDGDEIWWDRSISKLRRFVSKFGDRYDCLVVPTINLVGDIYHYQEERAGNYNLAGKVGHYNLRAVNRKIPGLNSINPHGLWGYADERGVLIQDRDKTRIKLLDDAPYLHASFLNRSTSLDEVYKRNHKLKHEIGINFPLNYYYPEVFFRSRPNIVPNVWENMDSGFWLQSFFETPLRKMKRRYLPKKVGY